MALATMNGLVDVKSYPCPACKGEGHKIERAERYRGTMLYGKERECYRCEGSGLDWRA